MPSFDSAGSSSSEINEQAQHEAYGSDNETASRRILISICLRDWLCYVAGRAFLFGGLGDSGADCFLIPVRPRSWLRLCRCAGSTVPVSVLEVWLRLRRRAASYQVIAFLDVVVRPHDCAFCLGVFAPACADDYDDYDLAVVADVLAMLSLYFAVLGRSLIIVVYVVESRGLATLRWDFSLTFSDCFFWAVLGRPMSKRKLTVKTSKRKLTMSKRELTVITSSDDCVWVRPALPLLIAPACAGLSVLLGLQFGVIDFLTLPIAIDLIIGFV